MIGGYTASPIRRIKSKTLSRHSLVKKVFISNSSFLPFDGLVPYYVQENALTAAKPWQGKINENPAVNATGFLDERIFIGIFEERRIS